ncbi:MAG TPA: hypothetical protein VK890_08590, partial [Bacteroidia bacterium]|nr:hypothetical protein [Bacteroidia bacterium]
DPILFISINLFNTLPEDNIWIGDENDRPQPNPQIGLNNLPYFLTVNPLKNFGIYNLYTGQLLGLTNPLQVGQATTTLRVDMSNMPNLSVGKMWIGVANTTPPTITIDSIPPYIHVNGSLNWDPLGLIQDSHAVPTEVGLGPKYLFIGSTDPATLNQINSTVALYIENLPPLTFNSIWRGDATGRPVESTDLTALETKVTNIQDVIIPQLEAEIAALQAELAALTAEVVELQTQIIAAAAAIAALQAQVLVIQGQFAALRLNNIPADGDVSFYGYKLINLANPVNPTDGVNLQTFENPAQFTFTNPFLNTPQITFNNLNPTSTSSGMLFTVAAANVGGIGYNNAASILYVNGYGSTAVNVGTTAANLNFSSVGDAVLTGTLYANRPAAYMYMQGNSTTTTIGTASFAKIAGTTTLSYGNEFTMPVNNRLFYINGTIASIQAYVTVSITCNFTLPDTASIVVYLNGSAITGSTISQDVVAATNVTFSTNAIIAMGTSNYIEIWLGSTVGNTVVVSSM